VLSVPVTGLRAEDEQSADTDERPEAFDMMRAALTGHPAIGAVLGTTRQTISRDALDAMRKQHSQIWELVHASSYTKPGPLLGSLIPNLEEATRTAQSEELRTSARELLTDTYQAAAAALSKLGEGDAAWIAADRAAFTAEAAGEPLTVAASMFRMAHVFLSLGQIGQAQQVANTTSQALQPIIDKEPTADTARSVSARLNGDRNDYGTEFGPSNVAIHAVAVAVELGDAGQTLDLARDVSSQGLSPERQARYLIDIGFCARNASADR
jgi:hypothetical protein